MSRADGKLGEDFDLVVAGAGFGGSLMALIGLRIGLRVLLIERGVHPRFAIGESTAPLSNLTLEHLCREYDIPALAPLVSYGEWKQTCPELTCGLKRGFSFYHHEAGAPFQRRDDHRNELLVAASPSDRVADTQWLRADVDHYFAQQAIAGGVEYRDRTTLEDLKADDRGVSLNAVTEGHPWSARSAFLIDATGPRGAASRMLDLGESAWPFLPSTAALFSHFEDVPAFEEPGAVSPTRTPREGQPYPPEWAAVHHVFEGGWIWSLRFDNGVTSLGVVCQDWLAAELDLSSGERGWRNLLDRFPGLASLRSANPIRPFSFIPRLPYRCARAAGPGWALLPGAAAFIDPFLSSGIPLTLLGIERLAALLQSASRGGELDRGVLMAGLPGYESETLLEADTMASYIAGCYAAFRHFGLLSSYLMYYFAALSFSEIRRRTEDGHGARGVGRGEGGQASIPEGFCITDPGFIRGDRIRRTENRGPTTPGTSYMLAHDTAFQAAIEESRMLLEAWNRTGVTPTAAEVAVFQEHVRRSIERVNIAGLADPNRRNWYPVDLEDVVRSAGRLDMTESEMRRFIASMPV